MYVVWEVLLYVSLLLVSELCPTEEQTRVRRDFQADGGGK